MKHQITLNRKGHELGAPAKQRELLARKQGGKGFAAALHEMLRDVRSDEAGGSRYEDFFCHGG